MINTQSNLYMAQNIISLKRKKPWETLSAAKPVHERRASTIHSNEQSKGMGQRSWVVFIIQTNYEVPSKHTAFGGFKKRRKNKSALIWKQSCAFKQCPLLFRNKLTYLFEALHRPYSQQQMVTPLWPVHDLLQPANFQKLKPISTTKLSKYIIFKLVLRLLSSAQPTCEWEQTIWSSRALQNCRDVGKSPGKTRNPATATSGLDTVNPSCLDKQLSLLITTSRTP